MTPLKHTNSIAARMGRWSATHRKTAIFGWLGFVLAALALGGAIGTEKLDSTYSTVGESGRADEVLADRFDKPPIERVLIQHPRLTIDDRAIILGSLEDPPEGLSELRAVLMNEHQWRQRDGLDS